jgi:predicted dehydrogenase
MSGIGVALVGVGPWGLVLGGALERAAGVSLRWICDLDPDRRARASTAHPATRVTARLDDVFADPEVSTVVVAVDAARHHAVARLALLAGRHVLVEKPMALSTSDALELETLARERARVLTVGHLLLHHAAVARARELVAAGALGDIVAFESVRAVPGPPRSAGGSWWTLAPHDVSLALHLFGASPVSITATATAGPDGDPDVSSGARLVFAAGRSARIQVARFAPVKRRGFIVSGDRRALAFDELDSEQPLTLHELGPKVATRLTPIPVDVADPLLAQCRHFLSCAARNNPEGGNSRHAVDVVRVLEAGEQSMRFGGAIVAVAPDGPPTATRKVA